MKPIDRIFSLVLLALMLMLPASSCTKSKELEPPLSDAGLGGHTGMATGGASASAAAGATGGANSSGGANSAGGTNPSGGANSAAGMGPMLPPPTQAKLVFRPTALGVRDATDFDFLPGTQGELVVLSKNGGVHHLRLNPGQASQLGAAQLAVYTKEGCGLLGLALDPEFAQNGYLYIGRCVDDFKSTLSRYDFSNLAGLEASAAEIMSITTDTVPPEIWHRWGSLGFEPDGVTMWALIGDTFIRELSQDPMARQGSLLRFLPNRTGGAGYTPASGNAFSDAALGDPTIYAIGLRSPFRGYRDREGRFWVGDVGLITWEEVNLVTSAGQNFGWPLAEGPCTANCDGLQQPLVAFGRRSDEPYVLEDPNTVPATKRAIWVGVGYEAPSTDRYYGLLDGYVLFGDFFTGWVRGLKLGTDGQLQDDRSLGNLPEITSMRLGPDGYLYALTLGGVLYRAEQALD
jgi:glucose/arabinose dehydrogenase